MKTEKFLRPSADGKMVDCLGCDVWWVDREVSGFLRSAERVTVKAVLFDGVVEILQANGEARQVAEENLLHWSRIQMVLP